MNGCFQTNQNNPMWNNGFMDAINIVSFLIGLQNLELNITAEDLGNQTQQILQDIHTHFVKEDEHLQKQDQHLIEQDERLDRLERLFENTVSLYGRKEN